MKYRDSAHELCENSCADQGAVLNAELGGSREHVLHGNVVLHILPGCLADFKAL